MFAIENQCHYFGSFIMLKSKLALALPLTILTLVGCSSSDNRFEPVDAPEVNNLFVVNELWSSSTGGTDSFYSELAPAFDEQNVYTASRKGKVYAFSQANGEEIWGVDLSDEAENDDKRSARLSGGVAINGNKLAVGSENGYIYLLSSANGAIVWKNYLGAEVVAKPSFNFSGDKLFVLDSRGNFTAFDTFSGTKLWVTGDAPQPLRLRAQPEPTVVGDEYLLVGTSSGKVNVILQSNGATVNQINVGSATGANALDRVSDVASRPLVLGRVLYSASYSGGLVEYDLGTFNYLTKLGYQTSRDMAYDNQSLVLTSDDGSVYCVNVEDNSQRWANTSLGYRQVTAPVIYGDYAVVGDYEGYLYFLDMNDGSIDYMDRVDSSGIYNASYVKNGKLYVLAKDGTLACYSYADSAKESSAKYVENINNLISLKAAQGLTLHHPGVYDSGIYAPNSMSKEQLEARRTAIKRAVAQQEAQIAAQRRAAAQAAKARAEYEARVKAYEQERRERLSGFGIAPGVRSDVESMDNQKPKADNTQNTSPATEQSSQGTNEAQEQRKSSNFGI